MITPRAVQYVSKWGYKGKNRSTRSQGKKIPAYVQLKLPYAEKRVAAKVFPMYYENER